MCLIASIDKGVACPSRERLETCFKHNPDGIGFMYLENGKVRIRKGYLTFDEFYEVFTEVYAQYGAEIPYVIHFRIASEGDDDAARKYLTHPYPLNKDMEKLKVLDTKCMCGITHNGIFKITKRGWNKFGRYNDTMKFITDYLTLIITKRTYYKSQNTLALITKLLGKSKLTILTSDGHLEHLGPGWLEEDGVMYSNISYKIPRKVKKDMI